MCTGGLSVHWKQLPLDLEIWPLMKAIKKLIQRSVSDIVSYSKKRNLNNKKHRLNLNKKGIYESTKWATEKQPYSDYEGLIY